MIDDVQTAARLLRGGIVSTLQRETIMSFTSRNHRRRNSTTKSSSAMCIAAESVEERILLSAAPIDGVGNNLQNPEWGSTGEDLLRLAKAEYADAISAVGGEDRPSARLISNTVSDGEGADVISDRLLSAMIYAWGQFIDHDITLTESGTTEITSIPVPTGDPSFDPSGTGTATIDTHRSAFNPTTGTDASNPREQVNQITAFLDGSMVYGSTSKVAAGLRTFSGGRLKTSEGNQLPLNNAATFPGGTLDMANENPFVSSDQLFAAGDVRANENVELTSLQTLFVREHNLQAQKIAKANPRLNDEQIYQKARSIVIAEIQAVTYNEWLPSLLGQGAVDRYTGYDATVNPGISNEFATAAFRFGHSLLGDDVEFLDNKGLETHDTVALSEAFFNPGLVQDAGIDSVLKYLSADPSSEVDTEVVDSIRNFLFGPPGAGGLDLASLNIQRGRDHGLADYNTVRESVGLPRVKNFSEITSDPALQAKLKSLYGSVDEIDLWVGGLAEDHVKGSSVGKTFQTIIVDQFERLRDGDRYWYQNQFKGKDLAQLQRTSLSDIIERNTSLTSVQQNAFFFKASISGTITQAANVKGNAKGSRSETPLGNVRVTLINTDDGSVVATAKTDRQGRYQFDVADGLRTGVYRVDATTADGKVKASSRNITITGGDDFERVNLRLASPAPTRTPPPTTRQTPPPPQKATTGVAVGSKNNGSKSGTLNTATGVNTPPVATNNQRQSATVAKNQQSPPKRSSTPANSPSSNNTSTAGQRGGAAAQAPSRLSASQLHALIDSLFATLPSGML